MFRKLLLPVDLTDRHQPALTIAREMAQQNTELVLLHVIEVIHGLSVEEEKPFYARLEKAAKAHLDRLAGNLTGLPGSIRTEIRYGNRIAEIVRYAAETDIDLILLIAPVLVPDNPAASWGSLSYKVSFFAPCPVLLVK
jgi:nucleotide-binding universal stress UspA family protein